MKENEARNIIINVVKDALKGEKVVCIDRKPLSRAKHESTFAVIFKSDEQKEQEVIDLIKQFTFTNQDFTFGGSEADNKFDMEFVALLVKVEII